MPAEPTPAASAGPVLGVLATAIGMSALVAAAMRATDGAFAYPMDDAYIHLGVAKTLAAHGTWGLQAGEFASASSSPAWTVLLAASFAAVGEQVWIPLAWNLAAAGLLFGAAAAWLRDGGAGPRGVLGGTLALLVAVPVPFLAALGMEHVLQVASVVLLLRAGERAEAGSALAPLAGCAALAGLVRYEGAFLAAGVGVVLATRGRWAAAAAAWLGCGGALGVFGAWSVARGGLPVPNSVLMKAAANRDFWGSLVATVDASGPLLALVAAVAAGAIGADGRHARRVALFVGVAAAHLVLARVGWLFRYEAYLVGWGALLLVAPAGRLARGGWAAMPVALAVAAPLAVRSVEAFARYPVGARSAYDTNVVTAKWIGETFPDATVATQDLGALAWYTDARLVDLAGIGTTEMTRLHLAGGVTPEAVSALLARRGVDFAFTGRDWMAAARPAAFVEVGSLAVPYPAGPGVFESVLWSVDPAQRARLLRALSAARDRWPPRVGVHVAGEADLDLGAARLEGAAVAHQADRIAFYTDGAAILEAPLAGSLRLAAEGTVADGRGPRFTVEVGGRVVEGEAPPGGVALDLGPVEAGAQIVLRYRDDAVDAAGGDRNLFVRRLTVAP